ncbi:MAG TPA: type II secretion system protein [Candidatus Pacearchaeota archaeon]|nr:type II secretion system protein [Candidatus Pacearchaeota archaeon]HOK94173.1 type II secretion system protein [Candidatus Pacearchaeota archaeon]HPO75187.1 type II secretion system protein [Candidatus Pacearchaeota archaeon]
MNKAFTLTELLVSISIIIVLSGAFFLNYQLGNKNRDLIDASHLILQEIRKAQDFALATIKMPASCSEEFPKSVGIYFSTSSPYTFDIFGDKDKNDVYTISDNVCVCVDSEKGKNECLERQALPSSVKIDKIKIGGNETECANAWINFLFYDLTTQINYSNCTPLDTTKVKIEICTISDCQNNRKSILINNKGMVEIQ